MAPDLVLSLSPFLGLGIEVAVQIAAFRLSPARGLLRSECAGFLSGLAGVALLNAGLLCASPRPALHQAAGHALLTLVAYAALGYCYFHFVNLGETARRIRIIRELHEAGGLSREELLARYGAREIVDRRLARLSGTGQVVPREGRLFIAGGTVLLMARAMVALKILLLGRASEYET